MTYNILIISRKSAIINDMLSDLNNISINSIDKVTSDSARIISTANCIIAGDSNDYDQSYFGFDRLEPSINHRPEIDVFNTIIYDYFRLSASGNLLIAFGNKFSLISSSWLSIPVSKYDLVPERKLLLGTKSNMLFNVHNKSKYFIGSQYIDPPYSLFDCDDYQKSSEILYLERRKMVLANIDPFLSDLNKIAFKLSTLPILRRYCNA